jgi:hypothetical protein
MHPGLPGVLRHFDTVLFTPGPIHGISDASRPTRSTTSLRHCALYPRSHPWDIRCIQAYPEYYVASTLCSLPQVPSMGYQMHPGLPGVLRRFDTVLFTPGPIHGISLGGLLSSHACLPLYITNNNNILREWVHQLERSWRGGVGRGSGCRDTGWRQGSKAVYTATGWFL